MMVKEISRNVCDPACITFQTCEGKSIQVNKYFLFLYDDFFRSILDENMEDSLVFIFAEASIDELVLLKEQIYQKHLQCSLPSKLLKSQNNKNNEDQRDPKSAESCDEGKMQEQDKEGKDVLDSSKSISSADTLTMECPFKCDEIPDKEWNEDTLFAHIFSKHWNDVRNNFFVSIDNFIDRLSSKLSSTKCALNCEKSRRVYQDLVALKTHYRRCHAEEDPVICPNCGACYRNSMSYYDHTRSCHGAECDLCNNGKKYKDIRAHMNQKHKEKTIGCDIQGCKLKFVSIGEQKVHVRVVHKKEKPFVCDKCGIRMAQIFNLKEHRIKVHREGNLTWKDYKEMIRSGQHDFVPKGSEIPTYM